MSIPELSDDGLCLDDLIAKTAKVSLKDTMRVLLAIQAVSNLYGCDVEDVLDQCLYELRRPTPEQIAACERAFFSLKQDARRSQDTSALLSEISRLR